MPSSGTLIHVPPTSANLAGTSVPIVASSGTFHATGAGLLSLFNSSVFASASLTALRSSAQSDLFEIARSALDKLPRLWSRVRNNFILILALSIAFCMCKYFIYLQV